jgi:4-amino-4-deoxy-L-arabinose transferase-like glycosyltransferase
MKIKILMLLILTYLLFFHNLGGIALWDPDEPRQAIMAREMMDRGDYIHPYLNGKPYLEKPPFFSWMIIAASKVGGSLDEFASRVPSAVSAALLVLATFYLGSMLLDPWGGFLGAAILATNYQFLSNARESVMDMTFAFFIGLTLFLAFVALKNKKKWLLALAFLPAALATLTKGPAGILMPACIVFIYLLVKKEMKKYFWQLAAGCILATAIASVWFLLAGEAYIKEFVFRQNITRYTNAFDHIESLAYYFHKLFVNFLPWSIFLPFALYHGYRKKYWFPLIWFAFIFLFFEISTSKRAIYLLSLYPAAALLTGLYIRDKWQDLVSRFGVSILLKLFSLILALIPLASLAVLFASSNQTVTVFRNGPPVLYVYIGLLAATGGAFFAALVMKSGKASLACFFLYLTVTGFFYNAYYMPLMDVNYKSPRLLTNGLKELKKDAAIYTYGFSSAGFIYYIGKPVQTFLDIGEIKEDKRDILLIIEDGMAPHLQKDLAARFLPVGKARYEKEHYTFYVRKDGR